MGRQKVDTVPLVMQVRDYILQILNGAIIAELNDPDGAISGFFRLHIHSEPPQQEVAFRNLCIKRL